MIATKTFVTSIPTMTEYWIISRHKTLIISSFLAELILITMGLMIIMNRIPEQERVFTQ